MEDGSTNTLHVDAWLRVQREKKPYTSITDYKERSSRKANNHSAGIRTGSFPNARPEHCYTWLEEVSDVGSQLLGFMSVWRSLSAIPCDYYIYSQVKGQSNLK
jgi:hypothetical protein